MKNKIYKDTARGITPLAVVHSESKNYLFFPTATPKRKIANNTAKMGWMAKRKQKRNRPPMVARHPMSHLLLDALGNGVGTHVQGVNGLLQAVIVGGAEPHVA